MCGNLKIREKKNNFLTSRVPLPIDRRARGENDMSEIAKKKGPSWRKLVVDGTCLIVYPLSKERKAWRDLAQYHGIEIEEATRDERKAYLKKPRIPGQAII